MSPGAEVEKVKIVQGSDYWHENQTEKEERAVDSGFDHFSQHRLFVLRIT